MESPRTQVVMDRTALARQVESVERSIIFLRQEQLTLLHGLHLEILSLQKRCTELTRELNVKPPGKSEAGGFEEVALKKSSIERQSEGSQEWLKQQHNHSQQQFLIGDIKTKSQILHSNEVREEEEQLEARCRDMEGRLQEQQQSQGELRTELTHKGALVGALRASLKEKERRFLEELKRRSHRSTALNTELQKQTEAAAYLSFQLHAARQKLQQQRRKQAALEKLPASIAEKPPTHSQPQQIPSVKPKRRSGSRLSSHLRAERARECVPRERVTGPEEPMAMPDPALFLHPRRPPARPRHLHSRALQGAVGGEQPDELDQGDAASRLVTTATVATAAAAQSKAD